MFTIGTREYIKIMNIEQEQSLIFTGCTANLKETAFAYDQIYSNSKYYLVLVVGNRCDYQ